MYKIFMKCSDKTFIQQFIRYLSATEISTALRPFYFSVHPDLFGKYPDQRKINENSLKQLSSFIETTQSSKPFQPCTLKFYLRDTLKSDGKFRFVEIYLKDRNVRNTINTILKTCNLDTQNLEKIPSPPNYGKPQSRNEYKYQNEYDIYTIIRVKQKIEKEKRSITLRDWLEKNYKSALEKYTANDPVRKDIEIITADICIKFGVSDIRWDCGWNEMHYRGCLKSFKALVNDHPHIMHALKGRILVFAAFTGVSLDGHIMLNSGEVRNNWLDLLKNVKQRDEALLRIPQFEKAVSQVLRNIKVVRRKFMPKILAEEYENHLRQLITHINDYVGIRGYPKKWPESLSNFQLVVETGAGPLMVSPTGQFIVPCSCPGSLLINFISENMDKAAKNILEYNANKHIEKFVVALCLKELQLAAIMKDDNITPDLMIKCCEQLLDNKSKLSNSLNGIHLNISTYYSVLSDGIVCIPWNFKLEEA